MNETRTVEVTLDGEAVSSCRIPARSQFVVAANLAFKWYDEILAGTKTVEHRDATKYWYDRLFKPFVNERGEEDDMPAAFIKFTRGYTKAHMTWTITRIDIDRANRQYHIHLGKRVD